MDNLLTQDSTTNSEGENLFARRETITRLLQSIDLSDYEISRIDRTYRIDPDRNGVVVILKDKTTDRLLKATADFKHGRPSWQQMMDLTFGIGEGSDIRVAVYDQTDSDDDPDDDDEGEYMAGSFVSILKSSGLSAHVVRMSVGLKAGRIPFIAFLPISERHLTKMTPKSLPSRKAFEQAEFWAIYHGFLYPSDPPAILEPSDWFGDIRWRWEANAGTLTTWDEEGIILHANFETPEDLETLNWLWDNNREEILDHYKGREVQIDKGVNKDQHLVVRFSSTPFRNFVLADKQEKKALTETFVDADIEFRDLIETLIHAKKDCGQPENIDLQDGCLNHQQSEPKEEYSNGK